MMILQDKVFVSTRPEGKSDELGNIIQQNGGTLLELPMIDIQPVELSNADKLLLKEHYDWLVFTSANGVRYYLTHREQIAGAKALIGSTKMAAIGSNTAKELHKYGFKVDYVNEGTTAEDFAKGLRVEFARSHPRVLLPVGNLAATTLEDQLEDCATIERIHVYQTVMPKVSASQPLERIVSNNYAMVIFTSPSSFINFCLLAETHMDIAQIRAVCIGETTAKSLLDRGIEPLVVANTMNAGGIAQAILEYYKK